MSLIKPLVAAACAAVIACGAEAQIVSSGIGEIDPWGMGYLEADEQSLPSNMWKASNADDLVPLMRKVRTRSLTPAERALLRRAVLSPALKPNGKQADDVLAERARIMFELGEAKAAAELMGRLTKAPPGLDPEQVSVDLQLALGNEATACGYVQYGSTRQGAYWARLRAACAALQNNLAGAELAIELAAEQGVNDPWLFSAVVAGLDGAGEPPMARFDSGISLALSAKADLKAPINAVAVSGRPDLAAAMAGRQSLPPELRVQGANVAAESGLISARDHRSIYQLLISKSDYSPYTSNGAALRRASSQEADNVMRARAYSDALRSASGSPARFAATSRLLQFDLMRLLKGPDTTEYAPLFARANLAAGDMRGAGRWSAAIDYEGGKPADPFDVAVVDALIILGGGDASKASVVAVGQRLVTNATDEAQKNRAARIFTLWTGFGISPPPEARALMFKADEPEIPAIPSSQVLAVKAAADADAAGEAILSLLGYTKGDPTKVRAADMAVFLEALGQIGARSEARVLALEAAGYWK